MPPFSLEPQPHTERGTRSALAERKMYHPVLEVRRHTADLVRPVSPGVAYGGLGAHHVLGPTPWLPRRSSISCLMRSMIGIQYIFSAKTRPTDGAPGPRNYGTRYRRSVTMVFFVLYLGIAHQVTFSVLSRSVLGFDVDLLNWGALES